MLFITQGKYMNDYTSELIVEPRQYRAFTLVELLVVISIIALLLSILMPSLQKARSQAQRIGCASNLRQIGLSMSMFSEANNGLLPPAFPTGSWTDMWANVLYSFIYPKGEFFGTPKINVLKCPAVRDNEYYYKDLKSAYGLNGWFGDDPAKTSIKDRWKPYESAIDVRRVSRPVDVIVVGDGRTSSVIIVGMEVYLVLNRHPGDKLNMVYADWHIDSPVRKNLIKIDRGAEVIWGPWTARAGD